MATEKKNGLKPIGNGIFLQKPCVIFTEWLATVWSRLEPAHWNKTNDADFSINYIAITTDVQSLIKVSAKEMFHLCCKKSETRTSGFIEDTHKFANSRYMSLNNNLIAIFFSKSIFLLWQLIFPCRNIMSSKMTMNHFIMLTNWFNMQNAHLQIL